MVRPTPTSTRSPRCRCRRRGFCSSVRWVGSGSPRVAGSGWRPVRSLFRDRSRGLSSGHSKTLTGCRRIAQPVFHGRGAAGLFQAKGLASYAPRPEICRVSGVGCRVSTSGARFAGQRATVRGVLGNKRQLGRLETAPSRPEDPHQPKAASPKPSRKTQPCFSSRCFWRFQSRLASVSRLSWFFLPLAMPTFSFTTPLWLK